MTNPTVAEFIAATLPYVTELELVAIRAIAESEYQQTDSTDPAVVDCHVWSSADYLSGFGLNPRSLPDVLSSLYKKGLTTHCDSDNDSTAALTATGHAIYLANRTA